MSRKPTKRMGGVGILLSISRTTKDLQRADEPVNQRKIYLREEAQNTLLLIS